MTLEQQQQQQQSSSPFKNFNFYWVVATCLGVWFLFVHAPPYMMERQVWERPMICVHLLGAYGVYLACMHNALLTPSVNISGLWHYCWKRDGASRQVTTDNTARLAHVWVGRIGLLLGLVAFVFGAYVAWTQVIQVDKGFVYFITVGGCCQVFAEIRGYQEIKKYQKLRDALENEAMVWSREERQELRGKRDIALKKHISFMLGLFVMGCGLPALIRLLGDSPDMGTVLFMIGLMNVVTYLYSTSHGRKSQGETHSPENEVTPLM